MKTLGIAPLEASLLASVPRRDAAHHLPAYASQFYGLYQGQAERSGADGRRQAGSALFE